MVREMMASGSAVLTDLAHAAKTTGEHVYWVLVRQQVVEGLVTFIEAGLWIGVMIYVLSEFKRFLQKQQYPDAVVGGGATVALIGLVLLFFLVVLGSGLKHMMNPEFYALKFLLESIKSN